MDKKSTFPLFKQGQVLRSQRKIFWNNYIKERKSIGFLRFQVFFMKEKIVTSLIHTISVDFSVFFK